MASATPLQIAISGSYGGMNLGDEAILWPGLHVAERLDLASVRVVQVEVDGPLLQARPLGQHR